MNAGNRNAVPEVTNPIAARVADRARQLREEFLNRGLFTAKMAADYRTAGDVPMQVVSSAVLGARAAEHAATTLVEGTAASIAEPVETEEVAPVAIIEAPVEPEPAVTAPVVETSVETASDELPPLADDVLEPVETKPSAQVAPTVSLRDQVIARIAAGIRETRVAGAQRTASPAPTTEHRAHPPRPDRPARPARPMRPTPAPKAEYVLGVGEYWCNGCPRRHVTTNPLVPELREIKRRFDHPPTRAELVAIAACEMVFQDEQRKPAARQVRWFPLDVQVDVVARDAVEHAARETADRAHTNRRAARAVAGAMPYVSASKPKASSLSNRGKQVCDGFEDALERMRSKR